MAKENNDKNKNLAKEYLELCTVDDLIEELSSRFSNIVIIGLQENIKVDGTNDKDHDSVITKQHGSIITSIGLVYSWLGMAMRNSPFC